MSGVFEIRIAASAMTSVRRASRWWRKNRREAPLLFDREFNAALDLLEHDRVDVGVRRAVLLILGAAFGIEPQQILFPQGYVRPDQADVERVRTRAKRLLEKKRRAAA